MKRLAILAVFLLGVSVAYGQDDLLTQAQRDALVMRFNDAIRTVGGNPTDDPNFGDTCMVGVTPFSECEDLIDRAVLAIDRQHRLNNLLTELRYQAVLQFIQIIFNLPTTSTSPIGVSLLGNGCRVYISTYQECLAEFDVIAAARAETVIFTRGRNSQRHLEFVATVATAKKELAELEGNPLCDRTSYISAPS